MQSGSARRIIPLAMLLSSAMYGQSADAPPFSVSTPLGRGRLMINGFSQFRWTNPAARHLDIPAGQFSVTASPFGDKGVTMFVQAGVTTFGAPEAFVLEAWASRDFKSRWRVQAGRMIVPFSRQFITSPSNLLLPDISAPEAVFSAPYAWGTMVGRTAKRASFSAAVISSPTPVDHLPMTRPSGYPGAVARVDLHILGPFGYVESDPAETESPQLSIGFAGLYSRSAFASAVSNTLPGDRIADFTVDGGFRDRRFTVQAAAFGRALRAASMRSSTDGGAYVQAGFYLIRHRLEVAGRIDDLHFGVNNNPDSVRSATERSIGLNLYLRGHFLKLQGDYSWLQAGFFSGDPARYGQFRLQAQFGF